MKIAGTTIIAVFGSVVATNFWAQGNRDLATVCFIGCLVMVWWFLQASKPPKTPVRIPAKPKPSTLPPAAEARVISVDGEPVAIEEDTRDYDEEFTTIARNLRIVRNHD